MIVDSTPYPWPYTGQVDPSVLALVVCGAGEEWSTRTPLSATVEANIERLRDLVAIMGAPAVLVRHQRPDDRPVAGLPSEASPVLMKWPGEHQVTSVGLDGFFGSGLDAWLRRRRRTQLLIVGRGFEAPVHSTLRHANDIGYECLTVHDACAPIDGSLVAASISSIEMSGGIFGAVATTDQVIAAFSAPGSTVIGTPAVGAPIANPEPNSLEETP